MDRKELIRLGTAAGAMVAIGTVIINAWSFAKPIVIHPPPWEELALAEQDEQKLAGLTQTDAQTQQYLKTMQQQVLFLAQQNWTLTESNAEAQLRQNPNNLAARQQLNTAKQALYGIQRQLYGK